MGSGWSFFIVLAFLLATVSLTSHAANPPQLRQQSLASRILGRDIPFEILPPPGYTTNATNRFPVLYWLPDRSSTSSVATLPPQVVHDAIRNQILPPLFVVYVRYGADSFYTDAASGLTPAATTLVHELIPTVDRTFRTLPDRQNRAIQGIGRGGFGAVRLALAYPELFQSAASHSGTFYSANTWATNTALRDSFRETFGSSFERAATNQPVYLAQVHPHQIRGRTGFRLAAPRQSPFYAETRALRDTLQKHGITVEWTEGTENPPGNQALPENVAVDALEFAASWMGLARATDRDGPWVNPPARLLPRLQHHLVYSESLERPVGYSLYLPPQRSASTPQELPVVYHLHGRDEDESRHLETTGYLDVALSLKEVEPFAWVWLYGGRNSWFMDSAGGRVPAQSVLVDEVIPAIERRWNLGGSPVRRAVDGWGMGGFGALRYAALHPMTFGAALIHNPVLPDLASLPSRFPDAWISVFNTDPRYFAENEPFRLLTQHAETLRPLVRFRVVVGGRASARDDVGRLRSHLDSLKFAAEWEEVPTVAGAGPELFRQTGLRDIQFLGKAVHRPEP